MAEDKEEAKETVVEQGASKLAFFLVGFGIGAVVALLFAPKSGRELREDIAETTRREIAKASEAFETTVVDQRERLTAAIKAGKQAYQGKKREVAEES
ncbi:MAG: YtxH domain-containing protein [Acidobacteria bacterium]|nr:YtxH domain-containing protein [Acidobacteriota bacterium]